MFPLLGGLISGGIGAISSMMNTSANNANQQQMQQEAEQFNQSQTLQQENFQTQMSNTAYQRASADMTAAGLNPASMFGSGSAASTPSGGASTIQPAQKTSAAGGVGSALQSVVPTAVALKTADATIDNLVDQNAKIKAETLTEGARPMLVSAETAKTMSSDRLIGAEKKNVEANLPIILDSATSAKNRSDMNPTARRALDVTRFSGDAIDRGIAPITNLANSATSSGRLFNDMWRDRAVTSSSTRFGRGFSDTESWRQ